MAQIVVHNMSEKYIEQRGKALYLNFRLPVKFGRGRVRVALKTSDIKIARNIRDRVVIPILYADGAINALEAIASLIHSEDKAIQEHIVNIKNTIFNDEEISINEALDRFVEYINKGTLRTSSKQDYASALQSVKKHLECNKNLNSLNKKDSTLARDGMLKTLSATRTVFCFQTFRKFLRWCEAEGLSKKGIVENFLIPLPTPDKQHTLDIPASLADQAMKILPEWTLPPRIARYTGMRLNEVLRLTPKSIVNHHGIYCFQLGTETKTGMPRIIPIAEKLKPFVVNADLTELKALGHKNDKYNRKLKTIPGLGKCKFHSWRTYANTRMMESGIDKAVRMCILGHKGSKEDIHVNYTSVQLSEMKKAVDTIL